VIQHVRLGLLVWPEHPCVVLPPTTSAWMMLQRNLLYTAVTRAKQLVVLVGAPRALGQAVRATGSGRRHTALTHLFGRLLDDLAASLPTEPVPVPVAAPSREKS
jgi:exodeoxyribonuclease V alpha subunit